jgi:hypothetical protein
MKKTILIFGVLLVAITLVSAYLSVFGHISAELDSLISFGSLIIVFIIVAIAYKKKNPSDVSFGRYFNLNMGIALLVSLVFFLFSLGFISVIDEDQKNTIVENQVSQVIEKYKDMDGSEKAIEILMDQERERAKSYFTTSYHFMVLVMRMVFYLIAALVVSAILGNVLKSRKPKVR